MESDKDKEKKEKKQDFDLGGVITLVELIDNNGKTREYLTALRKDIVKVRITYLA